MFIIHFGLWLIAKSINPEVFDNLPGTLMVLFLAWAFFYDYLIMKRLIQKGRM